LPFLHLSLISGIISGVIAKIKHHEERQ